MKTKHVIYEGNSYIIQFVPHEYKQRFVYVKVNALVSTFTINIADTHFIDTIKQAIRFAIKQYLETITVSQLLDSWDGKL